MRAILIPLMAVALIGASDEAKFETPESEEHTLFQEYQERLKGLKKRDLEVDLVEGEALKRLLRSGCRDRIERVEEDTEGRSDLPMILQPGGPLLRRGPNNPESPPLAIYAVDRRENGCGVMVMMGDINDVRPLPELDAEDHRLMPADELDGE